MLSEKRAANLKTVAARVGLAPCSVSAILNNTEAARAIPQATKDRVQQAARELNYRPNLWARSLRTKRTRIVAALAPGFTHSGVAGIVAAAQLYFQQEGYMLVLISAGFGQEYRVCAELQERGVEGILSVGAALSQEVNLPVTCVNVGPLIVDPGPDESELWISELGRSAAETLIRQIEIPGASRRVTLEKKTVPAFFDIQRGSVQFTSGAEPA